MAVAVNISSDFKANLAQLPDVDKVAAIELTYKDTGEPCGIANPHKREARRGTMQAGTRFNWPRRILCHANYFVTPEQSMF